MQEEKMRRVLEMTSVITGIPMEEIQGKNSKTSCVDARRIACFIIVKGNIAKLEKTGEFFGRKHTNIMFYLKTIYLVNTDNLQRVCNACQSFVYINLKDFEDKIKILPPKKYHHFKYADLIFKNPSNHE